MRTGGGGLRLLSNQRHASCVVIRMLDLRDVKKSFVEPDGTPLPILDIPEFHVAPGEQMVLVGRSGCGKTTLLHVIAGISRPDSGKVRVDDWDITLLPEAECDRFRAEQIGYVFQTFNLLRGFSALENVLLACGSPVGGADRRAGQATARARGPGASHAPTSRPCFRWASSSGWRSPGPWPTSPSCCWPTSRPPTSMPAISSRCSICCGKRAAKRTWRWCWLRTRPRWPRSSIASTTWKIQPGANGWRRPTA